MGVVRVRMRVSSKTCARGVAGERTTTAQTIEKLVEQVKKIIFMK